MGHLLALPRTFRERSAVRVGVGRLDLMDYAGARVCSGVRRASARELRFAEPAVVPARVGSSL